MLSSYRKLSVELHASTRLIGKIFDSCKAPENRKKHLCRKLLTIFDFRGNRAPTGRASNDIPSRLYWINGDYSKNYLTLQCFLIFKDVNAYEMDVKDLDSSEEKTNEFGRVRPMKVSVYDYRTLRGTPSNWFFYLLISLLSFFLWSQFKLQTVISSVSLEILFVSDWVYKDDGMNQRLWTLCPKCMLCITDSTLRKF